MRNKNTVIEKLFTIASKQQKTIVTLAQLNQGADPETIFYLKSAWQTSALNSGVTAVSTPNVSFSGGGQVDNVTVGEKYTVSGEIPAQFREKMLQAFKTQISSQKPDLDGKVSTIFNDPVTPNKTAGVNMDSKKVIEKLVKIAEKQQKIINKMAQDMGMQQPVPTSGASATWEDASAEVAPAVQQAARAVGAKATYKVQSAEFGSSSGNLKIKLEYPMAQLGTPEAKAVSDRVKQMFAGKTVAGGQVTKVEVIGVAV